MSFTPSENQQNLLYFAKEKRKNILVQACAGSGKTTTLCWLSSQLPPVKTLAISFNKSIADELSKRMPRHVDSCTMHSIGFRACRQSVFGLQVDDKKLRKIIDGDALISEKSEDEPTLAAEILDLFPVLSEMGVNFSKENDVIDAVIGLGRPQPSASCLEILPQILVKNDALKHVISFGDMIRHPVIHNYHIPTYEVVLVDEAQDLNDAQHNLLKKLVSPQGKLIAVGDRRQGIYGFRGADSASMNRIKRDWDCEELPLDVSYRCPKKIVTLAQTYAGNAIKPHENAEIGEIVYRKADDRLTTLTEMRAGDMALCRNNAPLVSICFALLRQGKKAIIKGKDIGAGLLALVKKSRAKTVEELLSFVDSWRKDQMEKAIESKKNIDSLLDRATALEEVAHDCASVADVERRISYIFAEDTQGIMLSTIHKAKGLEANNVIFFGPEVLESRQDEASKNLIYVAVTRAQKRLVMQPLPSRKSLD